MTRFPLLALCLLIALPAAAEHEGPWKRHTIDNTSRGADGVRLADANGDGLMDIATGWEEGGVVRLYLNPGKEKSKQPWPRVTVGKVKNVEDAVMVDLDNDGAMDVVSSCEGKTKTMYVHWGPKDKAKLLDEDAWQTEPIPATAGKQMWMYCTPIQIDDKQGMDLVVGSKGKGAAVGWLKSPDNPRDLKAWTYEKIVDAGWIMSLETVPVGEDPAVLVTDRKGPMRGVYELGFNGNFWKQTVYQRGGAEHMFACWANQHWQVATRSGIFLKFGRIATDLKLAEDPLPLTVPNPMGIRNGKAVAVGLIDADRFPDIVLTFNTIGQQDKPGVVMIQFDPPKPIDERTYDISGPEGKKFDRLELIDLDGDGDLDVLTCEEADNLGVIWYENPNGPANKKQDK